MQNYPSHLNREIALADGTPVLIRPIRPEDALIEQEFVRELSPESRYFRFMDALRELSPQMLSHFTDIDYDRHMALIAITPRNHQETEIAVARYIVAPDERSCEFAIAVADAWQGRGVGTALMRALMQAARKRGITSMSGDVLPGNHRMLDFVRGLGFRVASHPEDPRLLRIEAKL